MYLTLEELPNYGITVTSGNTALLETLLDVSGNMINEELGYSFVLGDIDVTLSVCCIEQMRKIFLPVALVNEINSINGIEYTGVKGTDYEIYDPNKRVLQFKRLPTNNQLFIGPNGTWLTNVVINVNAGVLPTGDEEEATTVYPSTIKYAQALIIKNEMGKGGDGRLITEYKQGPRTVKYGDVALQGQIPEQASKLLNKFRLFNIYGC